MTPSKAERIAELRGMIASMEDAKQVPSAGCARGTGSEEAFSRIVRLCSVRDRCTGELRKRLKDEDFDHAEIESALDRACSCNLVDDNRFADARIRHLVHAGKGTLGISRDLANYGISVETVPGWPYDYLEASPEHELRRALDYLDRRPSRSNNMLRGSFQKLIRQGYSTDTAMRAASIWTQGKSA